MIQIGIWGRVVFFDENLGAGGSFFFRQKCWVDGKSFYFLPTSAGRENNTLLGQLSAFWRPQARSRQKPKNHKIWDLAYLGIRVLGVWHLRNSPWITNHARRWVKAFGAFLSANNTGTQTISDRQSLIIIRDHYKTPAFSIILSDKRRHRLYTETLLFIAGTVLILITGRV